MGAVCSCCLSESSDTRTKQEETTSLLNECELPQYDETNNRIAGGSTTANNRTTAFKTHIKVILR